MIAGGKACNGSKAKMSFYRFINEEIRQDFIDMGISEAAQWRDLDFRKKAIRIYDKLIKLLNDKRFLELLRKKYKTDKHKGYVIPGKYIGDEYSRLSFILAPNEMFGKNVKAALGYGERTKRPTIVLPFLIGPFDLKYIETRINKDSLIHELIHYFDGIRSKGKDTRNSASYFDSGEHSDYFNDPGEFNAYYQEGAGVIERMVRNAKGGGFLGRLFKMFGSWDDFDVFYKVVSKNKSFFDQDWVDNMNNKMKRKFKKRLYGFFIYLKDKYDL